jgi:murein DD-endopeptidase MepM/ murein hydrolase activator NlpD
LLNWPRLTLAAAITLGTAGCSADSSRLSEFSGPSRSRPTADVTGSVAQSAPVSPAINSSTLPPPAAPPQQLAQPALSPPQPQQLVQTAPPPAPKLKTPAAPSPPTASKSTHTVVAGETLHKIARHYQVTVADLSAANKLDRHAKLKVGDQLLIPGARPVQPTPPKTLAQAKPSASASPSAPKSPAAEPPAASINMATPPTNTGPENKGAQVAPTLSFRRPVNGRVVSGFGPKPNGTENLGVNFAVPEGTPIKAAEDGVVAYASSELKSFGNLVMIRHASGYVTTYAHASEILVKRDEVVKRGQVIAKSGQTGNVGSPQLHFEIRKGATPIDPMPFLERSPG